MHLAAPRSEIGARSFSSTCWETKVGYCRAIRIGPQIWVTGTAPVADDGSTFAPGDAYAQAKRCLALIEKALAELDAGLADVVRTRMFVTDVSRWAEYGRAHHEAFAAHPPTTTLVEVKGLIDPEMLIEIEVDAFVTGA